MNATSSFPTEFSKEFQSVRGKSRESTHQSRRLAKDVSFEDLQETPSMESLVNMQQTIMQDNNLDGSNLGEYIISQLTQLTEQCNENWICKYSSNEIHNIHSMYDTIKGQISQPINQREQRWGRSSLHILKDALCNLITSDLFMYSFHEKIKYLRDLQHKICACIKQIQKSPSIANPYRKTCDDLRPPLIFLLKKLISRFFLFCTQYFPRRTIITFLDTQSNLPLIHVIHSPLIIFEEKGPHATALILTIAQHFIQNNCNLDSSAYIPSQDLWKEVVRENQYLNQTITRNPFEAYYICTEIFKAGFLIKMHNVGPQLTAITYISILINLKRYLKKLLHSFPINIDRPQKDNNQKSGGVHDAHNPPKLKSKSNIRDIFMALCIDDVLSFIYPTMTIKTQEQRIILLHAAQQAIMKNHEISKKACTRIYEYQHEYVQLFFQQCEQKEHQKEEIAECMEQLEKLLHMHDQKTQPKKYVYHDMFKKYLLSTLCHAIISLKNIDCHSCTGEQKIFQYKPQQKQPSIQYCIVHLYHEITVLHHYDVLLYLRFLNTSALLPTYQLPDNRQKIKEMITFLKNNKEDLKKLEAYLCEEYSHSVHLHHIYCMYFSINEHLQSPHLVHMQQQKQNRAQQETIKIHDQELLLQEIIKILLYIYELLPLLMPNMDQTFRRHFFASSCDSFTYIANKLSMDETLPSYAEQKHNAYMQQLKYNSHAQLQENRANNDKQETESVSSSKERSTLQEMEDQSPIHSASESIHMITSLNNSHLDVDDNHPNKQELLHNTMYPSSEDVLFSSGHSPKTIPNNSPQSSTPSLSENSDEYYSAQKDLANPEQEQNEPFSTQKFVPSKDAQNQLRRDTKRSSFSFSERKESCSVSVQEDPIEDQQEGMLHENTQWNPWENDYDHLSMHWMEDQSPIHEDVLFSSGHSPKTIPNNSPQSSTSSLSEDSDEYYSAQKNLTNPEQNKPFSTQKFVPSKDAQNQLRWDTKRSSFSFSERRKSCSVSVQEDLIEDQREGILHGNTQWNPWENDYDHLFMHWMENQSPIHSASESIHMITSLNNSHSDFLEDVLFSSGHSPKTIPNNSPQSSTSSLSEDSDEYYSAQEDLTNPEQEQNEPFSTQKFVLPSKDAQNQLRWDTKRFSFSFSERRESRSVSVQEDLIEDQREGILHGNTRWDTWKND